MPVRLVGPICARRGCTRPEWSDALCARCWRFGQVFGKPPALLVHQPLDGFKHDQDAPELPWHELDRLLGDSESNAA